jgi:hypothetical protein
MQMKLSPSDYRALLRRDLYAFIERCFYELNPTATFKPNWHLEDRLGPGSLSAWRADALDRQRAAALSEVAQRFRSFCRFSLGP